MQKVIPLFLFLVLVWPAPAALVNVALDAPAFANAPLYNADSVARLTDGNRTPQIHGDASPPVPFTYWLDLGTSRALTSIILWPRQDGCCPDRLSNVRLSVHDDDGAGNLGAEVWGADLFTDGSNAGSGPGVMVNVTAGMGAGTFAGRWVKLTSLANLVPSYALQLTEIEVFADGLANLARGAAATANRPLWSADPPMRLTDGDRARQFHGDTDTAPGFAYTINLGLLATIDHIKVLARQDGCCADRLSNYRVTVHLDSGGAIGAEVWGASLHTDGSNPGSGIGAKDVLTAGLHPAGAFQGQWIQITALADPVPNYALQMTEVEVYGTAAALLQILTQPQNVLTRPGRTGTFTVGVGVGGGDPALVTYQWQKNGVAITDATNASYTTPALVLADETNKFRCVVSYPMLPSLTSSEAEVDFNYALDVTAAANQPIWPAFNMTQLVNGNRADQVHGFENHSPGFAYTINLGLTVTISNMVIWARQDNCCADRLSNYRVSVHLDNGGVIGDEVWYADLHTDGSNPGSAPGSKDIVTGDLDSGGAFEGQWIKITALANPVPNYALQISEVEVFGSVPPTPTLILTRQPASATAAPGRQATFSVTAEVLNGNTNNITYQWQRNGGNIAGATNPAYTTALLCPADSGARFRCIASHPGATDLPSAEAVVSFDFNYASGAAAFANQALWPGFPINNIVDGSLATLTHGVASLAPGFAYTINLGAVVGLSNITIWPRQDNCCADRLSNYRVSVHPDNSGMLGESAWSADLHTDGSNPGSAPGSKDIVTADLDPAGTFAGQWIKIEALADPVPSYALQISEVQVIGLVRPRLNFTPVAGGLQFTWTMGGLEYADDVAGPWLPVPGAISPHPITFGGPRKFYRTQCP